MGHPEPRRTGDIRPGDEGHPPEGGASPVPTAPGSLAGPLEHDNPYCDRENFIRWLLDNGRERTVRLRVQYRNGQEAKAEFVEDLHDPYPGGDDPNLPGIPERRETPNGPCFIVELEDGTIRADHGAPGDDVGQPLPF